VASDDPLEPLQCRNGCDIRFMQYLKYEGSDLRICEAHRRWVKGDSYHPGENQTYYSMGLRCAECGLRAGHKDVSPRAKDAFDELLASVAHDLQDLADQKDTERVKALLGDTATVMEES